MWGHFCCGADQRFHCTEKSVKYVFWGHLDIREKVSPHDGCPFSPGSLYNLIWGRFYIVLTRCSLAGGGVKTIGNNITDIKAPAPMAQRFEA